MRMTRGAVAGVMMCTDIGFLDLLMLHWDGRRWRRVTVPDLGRITPISAPNRTDAWAVADCGLLRWNGRRWAPVRFPVPPGAQQPQPDVVAADRPDDVWLLGTIYNRRTFFQKLRERVPE
jgi:hypothetical protein